MYNQNLFMLRSYLLSKLKGFGECFSRFHGNTWGHTDVASATANVYMNFKLKRRDTGTADGESRGAFLK